MLSIVFALGGTVSLLFISATPGLLAWVVAAVFATGAELLQEVRWMRRPPDYGPPGPGGPTV